MQQPGAKNEIGECEGRAPLVPRWRRPWSGSFTTRNIVCRNYLTANIFITNLDKRFDEIVKTRRKSRQV